MRVVRERSPLLQIVTVFGGFFIGPFCGLRASVALAPESDLVQTAGVFGFALIFVGGTVVWAGAGIATVVAKALWNLVRGRAPRAASLGKSDRLVPPGYGSYVVLGTALGGVVGLIAGIGSDMGVLSGIGVWAALGTAYGLALWLAAHHGYLPFPEPE